MNWSGVEYTLDAYLKSQGILCPVGSFLKNAFAAASPEVPVESARNFLRCLPKEVTAKYLTDAYLQRLPASIWPLYRDEKWLKANSVAVAGLDHSSTQPGKLIWKLSLELGNQTALVDSVRKDIQSSQKRSQTTPEDVEADVEEALYEVFGSNFQKQFEDALWKHLHRLPYDFTGVDVDFTYVPQKEADFADATLEGTIEVSYEIEFTAYLETEKAIQDIVTSLIKV